MDAEAVSDLIYDQSLGVYYPAVTDYYGYYYTGAEPSSSEWDSHHQFFGQDPHISAIQAESLPNVYYIPSYGYVQSPYNPYNPSIPGAVMGSEASFVETHYSTNPPHQLVVSSPAYIPLGVDSSSETIQNGYFNPLLTSAVALPAMKPDNETKKLASSMLPQFAPMNRSQASLSVASEHLTLNAMQAASSSHSHTISIPKEVSVPNAAPANKPSVGSLINGGFHGVNQVSNQRSNIKVPSVYRQAKVPIPPSNGYTNYGSDLNQWTAPHSSDRFRPRVPHAAASSGGAGAPWLNRNANLPEQTRGPRTGLAKYQWVSPLSVKAYTNRAGTIDAEGNITISAEQFNRDDLATDFEAAKFFVIKSYSEDDVHKSIKYGVWSSTPSGNKRLDNAFEEAQKLPLGRPQKCPVFLFFSVNASGQFCGVAEMSGSVDFQKDMDFWQQDKWLGSFPVKWHVVKDISNTSLRHILLENNEYKPVTCSRDTQEIPYLQGMAMLRIFKSASSETSILDDFLIYEERQRLLFEEKAKISGRRHTPQHFFPPGTSDSTAAATSIATAVAATSTADVGEKTPPAAITTSAASSNEKKTSNTEENGSSRRTANEDPKPSKEENRSSRPTANEDPKPSKAANLVFDDGVNSIMKIGSLLIDDSSSSQNDVITVGSMHIKVGKQSANL